MSYMLEHAFEELPVEQIFIRPAYYFSNWLLNVEAATQTGILSTFYPVELKIPMISPHDVARFSADIMTRDETGKIIYELVGPDEYSSNDVAKVLGDALGRSIAARQIPEKEWTSVLKKSGFTNDGVENFIKMTEVVIAGKTQMKAGNTFVLQGNTTLEQCMNDALTKQIEN